MKKQVTIVLCLFMSLVMVTNACSSEVSRYTADQVIVVAQAEYTCHEYKIASLERLLAERSGDTQTPAVSLVKPCVALSYTGNGNWTLSICAPIGYSLYRGKYHVGESIVATFNEKSGKLQIEG